MKELTSKLYDTWIVNDYSFGVVAKDWYLAANLNRISNRYKVETFSIGDEPVFFFRNDQWQVVVALLENKSS